jgi:catechol 2,3-dioxygenase-like lactoylglutathione lyase family enzyme
MAVPARVSFVTLGCRDVAAMRRFYDRFGWPPSEHNDDSFAAYQCGGAVLGLFGVENYEATHGPAPARGAFRGVVLAINCRDAAEVDRVYESLERIEGVTLHAKPVNLSFGGRGFEWSDPEGNVWEVVWAEGTSFDDREGLIFP